MDADAVWTERDNYTAYGYSWKSLEEIKEAFPEFCELWDVERELAGEYYKLEEGPSRQFPDKTVVYRYAKHVVPQRGNAPALRFVTREEKIDESELAALQPYCPCRRCTANPLWFRDCACCVGCLWSYDSRPSLLDRARQNLLDKRLTGLITREHVKAMAWPLLALLGALLAYHSLL